MIIIDTESRIGRESLFLQLGYVPKKIKQSIASWGEYLPNHDLVLQLHREDVFSHLGHTYVRVLEHADKSESQSSGYPARVKHVEDIENGQKAYAIFDEKPKTQAYAGFVYELGSSINELADGYYLEVTKKLTVQEYLNK